MPTPTFDTYQSTAPVAVAGANYTRQSTAPTTVGTVATPTTTAPTAIAGQDYTLQSTAPQGVNAPAPAALPTMPSIYTPAFVELTGAGNTLATLNATASDLGKVLEGVVAGKRKAYLVTAGTDAQALPGIVRPANFNASTNAILFVAC